MDHYQVRGWTPWHRFITLDMLALALLVAVTATADQPTDTGLIALTVAEARRLLTTPSHDLGRIMRWSLWRRRVQARARRSHYKRHHQLHHEVPLEY